jgi:hypothetical protein
VESAISAKAGVLPYQDQSRRIAFLVLKSWPEKQALMSDRLVLDWLLVHKTSCFQILYQIIKTAREGLSGIFPCGKGGQDDSPG